MSNVPNQNGIGLEQQFAGIDIRGGAPPPQNVSRYVPPNRRMDGMDGGGGGFNSYRSGGGGGGGGGRPGYGGGGRPGYGGGYDPRGPPPPMPSSFDRGYSRGGYGGGGGGGGGRFDRGFGDRRGGSTWNNNRGGGRWGDREDDLQRNDRWKEPAASTGINFDKYDDIPVDATGNDVPDCIKSFSELELTPIIVENIALTKYTTPTRGT
ncbi:ATP-dependent RNA helicase bel-like [Pollicipes pollicipes]|uniref:ATP-dependent RNA helicase bel-like n=1 Tax=Pollicipes pollicipes TaxID=41117 RepID=UPI0018857E5A|nr:ATP-dependent RNA helicase bel-like [Pollicipes pollicipes]